MFDKPVIQLNQTPCHICFRAESYLLFNYFINQIVQKTTRPNCRKTLVLSQTNHSINLASSENMKSVEEIFSVQEFWQAASGPVYRSMG